MHRTEYKSYSAQQVYLGIYKKYCDLSVTKPWIRRKYQKSVLKGKKKSYI